MLTIPFRLDLAGGWLDQPFVSKFYPGPVITDDDTLNWIENHLWFINLSPRDQSFDVLSGTNIGKTGARALADAANGLWGAIAAKDIVSFGHYFRASYEAQIAMFPDMVTPQITEAIKLYEKKALGWKISGAGGGGYLVLISEVTVENAMQIRIRR